MRSWTSATVIGVPSMVATASRSSFSDWPGSPGGCLLVVGPAPAPSAFFFDPLHAANDSTSAASRVKDFLSIISWLLKKCRCLSTFRKLEQAALGGLHDVLLFALGERPHQAHVGGEPVGRTAL